MSKNVEFHDDCPVCNTTMRRTKDKDRKHLLYYCKKCKQNYRIDVIHPMQEIECPHCDKVIKLSAKQLSQLHSNTVFNFYSRKVKI
jgi:transcription elongation factor Elf1